jgi:hypothetical protein
VFDNRFGTRYSNSIGNLIVANEAMNYEVTTRYTTTVYITDTRWGGWDPITTDAVLTVRVIDINERPNIDDQTRYVEENAHVDRFIGKDLYATDPDNHQKLTYKITKSEGRTTWKIGACDGQLMVAMANINYEQKSSFKMTVKVTDSGITGYDLLSDTGRMTIKIIDVNEAPTMNDLVYAVDENVPVGTIIGPGRPISVALGDVDNLNSAPGRPDWQTHKFKIIAGNDGDTFALDENTGQLTVNRQDGCLTGCSVIIIISQTSILTIYSKLSSIFIQSKSITIITSNNFKLVSLPIWSSWGTVKIINITQSHRNWTSWSNDCSNWNIFINSVH